MVSFFWPEYWYWKSLSMKASVKRLFLTLLQLSSFLSGLLTSALVMPTR
jgi:hypothetical protein